MAHEIEQRHEERKTTAQVHFRAAAAEMPARFGEAFGRVAGVLARQGVTFDGPAFARYTGTPDAFEVDAGFLVQTTVAGDGEVVAGELPECDALVTTHMGSYETLHEAYDDLQAWAREHGKELDEPVWGVLLLRAERAA